MRYNKKSLKTKILVMMMSRSYSVFENVLLRVFFSIYGYAVFYVVLGTKSKKLLCIYEKITMKQRSCELKSCLCNKKTLRECVTDLLFS